MKVFVPVLDYPSGRPVFQAMEDDEFAALIMRDVDQTFGALRRTVAETSYSVTYRGEVARTIEDLGNPREAGWNYVIHADDPRRNELIDALEPLALHRGMAKPREPLLFDGRPSDQWSDWLEEAYPILGGKQRPFYFLLAGTPQWLPFELQSYLDVAAAVGRLDFDDIADYRAYATKVIRRDDPQVELCDHTVVLFATDKGPSDPTFYSRTYMAQPLAAQVRDQLGFNTLTLFGSEATRDQLTAALCEQRPALVYTATHGFSAFNQPDEVQRRINGAIECELFGTRASVDDFLFGANNVPTDIPFIEGSVLFQFACLGYGTPADSHFARWFPNVMERHTATDFVAALPKRLIAHPRGPVAFIGHLDLAFLHGFTDADAADIIDPWHARLDPFASAVKKLLSAQPVGLALGRMNTRAASLSNAIVNAYQRIKRNSNTDTPEFRRNLAQAYVKLNDARNYMVLGDPATRLRISDV